MQGFDGIEVPTYCFLVSNGRRHVVFDLGVRRDWENYAPNTTNLIRRTTNCQVAMNISEILDEQADASGDPSSIRSADIEAIIWSHHHFDHIGDPSTFPASTALIVGPGVSQLCWPGYPSRQDAMVLDADIKGRDLREIDFSAKPLRIGPFDAFDYFEDGSFYLLDSPGHSTGHMTALARVTTGGPDGDSFVFMGADACHHPGVLRPSEYLPLPAKVSMQLPKHTNREPAALCPGEALQQLQRNGNAAEPFFDVSPVLFPDIVKARDTVRKIMELDAADDVLIILAHDRSIKDHIDLFPKSINDWRVKGVRSSTRWLFCTDFSGALALQTSE